MAPRANWKGYLRLSLVSARRDLSDSSRLKFGGYSRPEHHKFGGTRGLRQCSRLRTGLRSSTSSIR